MISTSSISYRIAHQQDIRSIAALHAASWQHNYRGIWPDSYLDQRCLQERQQTWTDRLSSPPANQYVIIAEEHGKMVGFGCCYLSDHREYGTLLDNIHVTISHQGRGIGAEIMRLISTHAMQDTDDQGFYLWVLRANIKSLRFYQNLKGTPLGSEIHTGPAGIKALATKIVWSQCSILIAACEQRRKS